MATLFDESDHDAQQHFSESTASVALSSSDLRFKFLVSSSFVSPIPCLGGWGSDFIFRSPALPEKATF